MLDDSLAEIEQRLPPSYCACHRNAIVALSGARPERRVVAGADEDEGSEGWAVCIAPISEWLSVSRRQVAAVREALLVSQR